MSIPALPSGYREQPPLARGASSSDAVEKLLSYQWNDWCVTEKDEREAVALLADDDHINQTIAELESRDFLTRLFSRIDDAEKRRTLIDGIADRLDDDNAAAVQDALREVDRNETGRARPMGPPIDQGLTKLPRWEIRFNLARAGVAPDPSSADFNRDDYSDVLAADPDEAGIFTGSGATGVNPADRTIPLTDQWQLYRNSKDSSNYPDIEERYSNPLSHEIASNPVSGDSMGHPEYWQSDEVEQWLANYGFEGIDIHDEKTLTAKVREKVANDLYESALSRESVLGSKEPALKDVDLADKKAVQAALKPRIDDLTERYVETIERMDYGPDHERRRSREAELLLNAPVSSSMPTLYGNEKPTRASVIAQAAQRYDLEPELVAGIILAEQRDQSANEDAADFRAAVMTGHNSSIGLGQVTVSTAMENDAALLADSLSEDSRKNLTRSEVAKLLADDVINIFATAAAIRRIADQGAQAGRNAGGGEAFCDQEGEDGYSVNGNTCAYGFSGRWTRNPDGSETFVEQPFDITAYAKHSKDWPTNHVRVIGSEYTTLPWDDTLFRSWGALVMDSYTDVKDSEVFG